jgi:ribosomal protein S18 acetylase RimI-like enzyme
MYSNFITELMDKQHDKANFSCGIRELDNYIKQQASQDSKRNLTKVYVIIRNNKIIGYYTLSAIAILQKSLPEDIIKKLPKYPMPAILLGRLAIDQTCQKQNFGKSLLIDIMKRSLGFSSGIGIYALVVDAKNDIAKSFYQYFGFSEFIDEKMRLFIPMTTISKLFYE